MNSSIEDEPIILICFRVTRATIAVAFFVRRNGFRTTELLNPKSSAIGHFVLHDSLAAAYLRHGRFHPIAVVFSPKSVFGESVLNLLN